MKKHRLIILLLFPFFAFADTNYQAIADIDFSPYSGGEDIITVHRTLMLGEDKLVKRPPGITSIWRAMGRIGELILWDFANIYLMVVQHEIFGHGYRIRDLGSRYAKVEKYSFFLDGAVTEFDVSEKLTSSQAAAIAIGGVEATAILANRLRLKWLEGEMDGRQATLYLWSQHDITTYTQSLDINGPLSDDLDGHDMGIYVFFLNATYPEGDLTKKQLKKIALINLADPFTYLSVYGWFHFAVTGNPAKVPMIPIGEYRYLPSIRLGLAPFGPEYFVENFLVKDNKPIYFYLKGGKYAGNTYYGAGIEQPYLLNWKGIDIGYRLDLWRQPNVIFKKGALQAFELFDLSSNDIPPLYSSSTLNKKIFGFALSAILQKQIRESAFSLYLQPGFKTKGFLPGQALRTAPILRGGLSITF
ncbi:MAG: hypothetical protein L0207_04540 [Chlamydiae bacterium]|nr:hypothetical protein [Chlamydiota bacterium]